MPAACGDAGERDGSAGPVELAQGLDGPGAGQLVPPGGGGGSGAGGSGRIGGRLLLAWPSASSAAMILSRLRGDLLVHLGDAGVPGGFGGGDDLQGGLPLGVVLREELRPW